MTNNAIYSPQMLWRDFDSSLDLKVELLSEESFGDVTYQEVYFSGREVAKNRVRIYGVYASGKNLGRKQNKSAILILPDVCESVNHGMVADFAALGYNVLMLDFCGENEKREVFTKYPQEINYANYSVAKDSLDSVPKTAKDTCWYEWVAVAKYGISFLKAQPNVEKVGVLGIKNGANVGWMLAGSDSRVDCFCPLFGAGWRAYKNIYKNSNVDLVMNEERIRFLAGVEAQAYAQSVNCPVLYQTATNNDEFDIDRSADTLTRILESAKPKSERFCCYAPRFKDVLNSNCRKNIEIFFSTYLQGGKIAFPFEPKVSVEIEDKKLNATIEIDFSETKKPKKVEFFVCEGIEKPSLRDWNNALECKTKTENSKKFVYLIDGASPFVSYFALIEYKNGITLCSKVSHKKLANSDEMRGKKLIYSSKEGVGSFSVCDEKKNLESDLFFMDNEPIKVVECAQGIEGITSNYGLVSYKINPQKVKASEDSLIMLDVYSPSYNIFTISLMVQNIDGTISEYLMRIAINGLQIWQNFIFKCSEFKSEIGMPIKDFGKICGLKISSSACAVLNNLLLI